MTGFSVFYVWIVHPLVSWASLGHQSDLYAAIQSFQALDFGTSIFSTPNRSRFGTKVFNDIIGLGSSEKQKNWVETTIEMSL